ncbi:MAG: PHP domain-containing protein [Desulfobacterales bacterium]|nr:PHP domain-containing protein [Desulfobacterales bacterium]
MDLHVHTRRFSACAETLDPGQLPLIMARRGLHGVVLTEHDQLWPAAEIAALNRKLTGGRIYRGVEVSSRHGHFLVIGLDDMQGLRKGMAIEELLASARSSGAVVVWAHPLNNYDNTSQPMTLETMPPGIHAVETAGGRTRKDAARQALAYARRMGCTPVAGSDAHVIDQVGCAFTRFARLPKDEKRLAAAIRAGRCRTMEMEVENGS